MLERFRLVWKVGYGNEKWGDRETAPPERNVQKYKMSEVNGAECMETGDGKSQLRSSLKST